MKQISVIMSTYNGQKFLEEQINSIQSQQGNERDFKIQLYIRDDKSNDNTMNQISKLPNITIVPNGDQNIGVKSSFFALLDVVPDSELIFFSDQDDIWPKNKVKKFLESYGKLKEEEKKMPIGLFSDLWISDTNGISTNKKMSQVVGWAPESNYHYLSWSHKITGAAFAINTPSKNLARTVQPSIRKCVNMHDSFIALLISITGKLIQIDEPLLMYRQHANNIIGAKKKRSVLLKFKSIFKLATRLYNDDLIAYEWMVNNQHKIAFNDGALAYFNSIYTIKNNNFFKRLVIWRSMLKYMMSSRLPFTTFYLFVLKRTPQSSYWEL